MAAGKEPMAGGIIYWPEPPTRLLQGLALDLALEVLRFALQVITLLIVESKTSVLSSLNRWREMILLLGICLLLQCISLMHILFGIPALFRQSEYLRTLYDFVFLLRNITASTLAIIQLLFLRESEENRIISLGYLEICLYMAALCSLLITLVECYLCSSLGSHQMQSQAINFSDTVRFGYSITAAMLGMIAASSPRVYYAELATDFIGTNLMFYFASVVLVPLFIPIYMWCYKTKTKRFRYQRRRFSKTK